MCASYLIIVLIGVFALPARASVLCSTTAGTVKIRPTCKRHEVQVDPITIGLQGPPEPGLVVKDVKSSRTTIRRRSRGGSATRWFSSG